MLHDLRFALRMIRSNLLFSAAIVLTLALGIGINTTVFTLVNAVLFKPLELPTGGDRLTMINGQNPARPDERFGVSWPDFLEFRQQSHSFDALEAYSGSGTIVSENAVPPERVSMARISRNMFEMVGVQPVLGRGLTEADMKAGAPAVAILSYRLWNNRYGKASNAVGRFIRLNGQTTAQVVGVMPDGFRFPSGQDLWVPLQPLPEMEQRSHRPLQLVGLRRPGLDAAQASTDLARIAARQAKEHPATNKDVTVLARTFHEAFNGGSIRTIFLLMMGAVGFVLLIACANVANMMLGRALARRREISVRTALGASRGQLIRQLLTESVVLSVTGGLLGLAIALVGVYYFDLATLKVRPHWISFRMDWLVFVYFTVLSVASGLIFGIVPALRASRVNLASELKDGTRAAGSLRGGWLAASLVVVQFALTVVLLTGAGLFMRGFLRVQNENPFVPASRILTAHVGLPEARGEKYAERAARVRFYDELLPKLNSMPGGAGAAIVSDLPGLTGRDRLVEVEDHPVDARLRAPHASFAFQSPGAFSLIGLALAEGRDFDQRDGETGREAAVVTRQFALRHWPAASAVGKRFRFFEAEEKRGAWITIIGVSRDLAAVARETEAAPLVFLPHRQEGWGSMSLMVRAAGGMSAAALAKPAQTVMQSLDPDLPASNVQTLEEALGQRRWMLAVFGSLFFCFAIFGLVIASVGIYAVVAQAAAQRTREIGIRIALGATARSILSGMLARGAGQLGIGLALGAAGAVAAARAMRGLPGVQPDDPVVFVIVVAILAATGLAACWLPARRAARLHPVEALREE